MHHTTSALELIDVLTKYDCTPSLLADVPRLIRETMHLTFVTLRVRYEELPELEGAFTDGTVLEGGRTIPRSDEPSTHCTLVVGSKTDETPLRDENLALLYAVLLILNQKLELSSHEAELRTSSEELNFIHERLSGLSPVFAGTGFATWDWKVDKNELSFNDTWFRKLGYRREELRERGETWEMLIHPADFPDFLQTLRENLEGKTETFTSEHRLLTKSDDWHWVHTIGRVTERDGSGNALRHCGVVTFIDAKSAEKNRSDRAQRELEKLLAARTKVVAQQNRALRETLTDLRETTEALYRSEERFRSLVDLLPHCVFELDVEGRLTFMNESGLTMFGYEARDLDQSFPFKQLFHPDDRARAWEHAREAAEEARPLGNEFRGLHRNGGTFPLLSFTAPNLEEGELVGWRGASMDLTPLRRAESHIQRLNEELERKNRIATVFLTTAPEDISTALLEIVLESLQSAFGFLGTIDEQGRLICESFTRDIWKTSTKAHKTQKTQKTQDTLVFPRQSWRGLWGQALLEGKTTFKNGSLEIPTSHVQLECALATPIKHLEELVGEIVVANRIGGYSDEEARQLESIADMVAPILAAHQRQARSEEHRKKIEAENKALERQLNQAQRMEAIGRLAGGVAHDFNNILTAILGSVALAMDSVERNSEAVSHLDDVTQGARRAAELTGQLLIFSRRQVQVAKITNLNELIEGMVRLLSRLIGEDVRIELELTRVLPYVEIDPSLFEQVVVNLAVNARDAMPKGGTLTIRTAIAMTDPATAKLLEIDEGQSHVRLEVSDTGTGIAEELMEQIFDPFFTTKAPGRGTGLGLAMVYGTVRQSGGHIEVDSALDKGTTFIIHLPSASPPTETEKKDHAIEPSVGGTETLLVVEDDDRVRKLMNAIATNLGYRVLIAADGRAALRLFEQHAEEIDLLVTDVIMPNINGRQLSDEIRRRRPNLPVLFTSGYTDDILDSHGVFEAGSLFLPKPFSPRSLAAMLREALDQ